MSYTHILFLNEEEIADAEKEIAEREARKNENGDENDDIDDYPFQSLQNVMRAYMRTHKVCNKEDLMFFRKLWQLYGDYHTEVEWHGDDLLEFDEQVLKYLSEQEVQIREEENNVKLEEKEKSVFVEMYSDHTIENT